MNSTARLRAAAEWAASVMDGVRVETLDGPTTCDDWDLRTLANHLTGSTYLFAGSFDPDPAPVDLTDDFIGDDPGAAFREGMAIMLARFDEPGTIEQVSTLPIGKVPGSVAVYVATQELLVHAWDVARSTGQDTSTAPQDVAAAVLAVARSQGGESPAATPFFAAAVAVDDGLPAIDRLAAYRGRSPEGGTA